MTCGFCNYEFCWACGASATPADNHFGLLRGCGVRMMDDTAKPGSKAKSSRTCQILKYIGMVLLCIILYPFFLVLYMPLAMGYGAGISVYKDLGWCAAIIFVPIGFVFGLILDICFIPAVLIITLCFLVYQLFKCFRCIFCYRCNCDDVDAARNAEEQNRTRAEAVMKGKKDAGKEGDI